MNWKIVLTKFPELLSVSQGKNVPIIFRDSSSGISDNFHWLHSNLGATHNLLICSISSFASGVLYIFSGSSSGTCYSQQGGWRCCWFILTTTEQYVTHTFLQIRVKCLSYSHDPSDFTLRKSTCSRVGLIYEKIYPNLSSRKVSLSFTQKSYAGPPLKWQEKMYRCLKWNKKSWETSLVQHIETELM